MEVIYSMKPESQKCWSIIVISQWHLFVQWWHAHIVLIMCDEILMNFFLKPVRVSYRGDFLNLYRVYMMTGTGSFHISQKCIQVYKCINGLASVYLLDDFHSSEQIHNYDTRNKDLIHLPLARTTKFQTPFKYNAAKSWNTLPRNLRHDQSLTSFKLKVKKYLNHFS